MLFSYNWLQSLIKGKLPKPEKLAEVLTMHSFEVEELKNKGKDWVLDIAVTANRASDCFSHIGIAREISAITEFNFLAYARKLNPKIKEDKKLKARDFINVDVKHSLDCPRYAARVITDIKIKPSPKWIQERLISCNLRPINNVVDSGNYVMLETGQPLHVFDLDKLSKGKIIVRRAKKGEKIISLDNEKYELDDSVLIIADQEDPLAVAGIKGGRKAEISAKTKNIVLESANFEPHLVRKASQKLKIRTDASLRFEHGLDPNLCEQAINRLAELIQDIAGGNIARGLVDVYPNKTKPRKIRLNLDYVESLLGVKISKKEIKNILQRLSFQWKENSSRSIDVKVPTRRMDINIQEDLIEEIGRLYGYEKIPADFPTVALVPPKKNFDIFWEDTAKNILKEAGLTEVYNYSFISEEQKKVFNYENVEIVELENPMSSDSKYLRPSLIPNLVKNTRENAHFFEEFKIFELGKVFKGSKNGEKRMLSGAFFQEKRREAFYELKGVIDSLLNKLGSSNVWYDSYKPTPEQSKITIWNLNKCAEVKVDNQEIGFLGELSSKVLRNVGIPSLVVFDLDFEKLSKLTSEEHEYQPISKHPAAIRDLAVLVSLEVKVVEVLNKINTVGGKLVRDVDLFDIYEGEELPENKKNLAFHIIYQAENRTLKSGEVDNVHQKIVRALEKELEWQVRR